MRDVIASQSRSAESGQQGARLPATGAVTCILNGAAGSNRANTTERLADLFAAHGVESRILLARNGSELAALARRAVEERGGTVIAAGGDGTMNAVASALVGTESPMGVLPLGTLNHFAKDLKIPLELERAVATVFTGRVGRIDAGEVNGHLFLNNSSLGIYPWIVRERETEQRKGYGKWLAFGRAFFPVLMRYPLLQVQLRIEGSEKAEVATPFVFVGNNRYESQGLNIGQRSALDEGRLWVCHAPPVNRSRLLLLTIKHVFGSGRVPDFESFDAEEVSVGTRAAQLAVATDGEVVLLRPPLQYRTRRGALRVIVPAEADGADRN